MQITDLINFEKQEYNWAKILDVPEFAKLQNCQQNPKWHHEGTAWVHTIFVCDKMLELFNEYGWSYVNNSYDIKILMTAALFHDIGKSVTTEFKKGNWHAYNHEFEGEKITRRLLWNEGYVFREAVCSLVRYHMEPLKIFEGKDYLEKICSLSKRTCLKHLLMLKLADLRGSVQEDLNGKVKDCLRLSECERFASLLGCLHKPAPFPTNNDFLWNFTNKKSTVVVMIGLPGSGKDTLIQKVFNGETAILQDLKKDKTIVLSRDDIRIELGFCREGEKYNGTKAEEEEVSKVFNERLHSQIKKGGNVIINNMNLKKKYRDALHEDLKAFDCKFIYVYVETETLENNIERRAGQIDANLFQNMITNFDWPDYTEYDKFEISIN